jgi:hypothetical protein
MFTDVLDPVRASWLGWASTDDHTGYQIPASVTNAPGSSLGFWRRNGDRAASVVPEQLRRVAIDGYLGSINYNLKRRIRARKERGEVG